MLDKKIVEVNEENIKRLSKRCKVCYLLFRALLVLCTIAGVAFVSVAIIALFRPSDDLSVIVQSWTALFSVLILSILLVVIFGNIYSLLKDITKGESPFKRKQAKRFRNISFALVIYAVLSLLISVVEPALIDIYTDSLQIAAVVDDTGSHINLMTIVFALVMFSVSVIFEYGAKLQEQSDEIL